jgi:hypothetical protein
MQADQAEMRKSDTSTVEVNERGEAERQTKADESLKQREVSRG